MVAIRVYGSHADAMTGERRPDTGTPPPGKTAPTTVTEPCRDSCRSGWEGP